MEHTLDGMTFRVAQEHVSNPHNGDGPASGFVYAVYLNEQVFAKFDPVKGEASSAQDALQQAVEEVQWQRCTVVGQGLDDSS